MRSRRAIGSRRSRALAFALLLASAAAAEPIPFSFTKRASDFEGRWVVLPPQQGKDELLFAFVYVDPQAGFTLDVGGKLKVDAQGKYVRVPDANAEKARFMVRLDAQRNPPAAPLPKAALEQLGLEETPELMKFYADRSDPLTHKVTWGRHYNHVGACGQALTFLEPAYKEKPDAKGLVFELSYAYNALGRFDDALAVLKEAVARRPEDVLLGSELAYAYVNSGQMQPAIALYLKLIPLCAESQMLTKSEMAMNLSAAYERLGDKASAEKWRANAKAWAPPGTPLYQYFNR